MIHDELLEKINEGELGWYYGWMQDALRAVTKLHKPRLMAYMGNPTLEADTCEHCGYLFFYPCPTIQAIEKELE